MEKFLEAALQEAYEGIEKNHGGPFGAVVVKNGKIVGRGHNRVLYKKDPTCHGEMEAIRDACKNLGTHDLTGCQLYTTAEPCPMCLGGILWSNIQEVYFGCDRIPRVPGWPCQDPASGCSCRYSGDALQSGAHGSAGKAGHYPH